VEAWHNGRSVYMCKVWKILSKHYPKNLKQPVGLARVRQDGDLLQSYSSFRYFSICNGMTRRTEENDSYIKSESTPTSIFVSRRKLLYVVGCPSLLIITSQLYRLRFGEGEGEGSGSVGTQSTSGGSVLGARVESETFVPLVRAGLHVYRAGPRTGRLIPHYLRCYP